MNRMGCAYIGVQFIQGLLSRQAAVGLVIAQVFIVFSAAPFFLDFHLARDLLSKLENSVVPHPPNEPNPCVHFRKYAVAPVTGSSV